ncbi:tellurite resistance TerB family protein [Tropicimonas sp. IMCC34043]|uniref:tellurite resistance TerB family protein n=1 Tax=Tropicimonas sp. IMCC34043 TaxID=2248760 RepID=UPI000E2304B5|nr:tellurite resistance TerB family protein [Tropicimonas sp. IMCC34043]
MAHDPNPISPQDALVAVMIATSVSDENIRTSELVTIERIVNHLPIFGEYDADHIRSMGELVFDLFEEEDGVDALLGLCSKALPEELYETAYALCCDVAASDGRLSDQELQLLAEIRYAFNIPRLHAASIEWGARVRHRTI